MNWIDTIGEVFYYAIFAAPVVVLVGFLRFGRGPFHERLTNGLLFGMLAGFIFFLISSVILLRNEF